MEAQKDSIDRILDEVEIDELLRRNPLTARERELLRQDLERNAEIRDWFGTTRLHASPPHRARDVPWDLVNQIKSHIYDELRPSVGPGEEPATLGFQREERPARQLPIVENSFAAWWYLRLIVATYRPLLALLDRAAFERDDIAAIERAYHRAIEYERFTRIHRFDPNDSVGLNLLFEIAEWLYHDQTPGYTGFIDRIGKHSIDWRDVAHRTYLPLRGVGPAAIRVSIVKALEEAVAEREETQFGRGAPLQREAADDFDRNRGALLPKCDFWTYHELEFWSRVAIRSGTAATLCGWLRTRQEIDVEGECETLPLAELLPLVQEAVTFVPKSALCALLASVGATPPVPLNWDDVSHFNVKVLPYLPPEARIAPVVANIQTDLLNKLTPNQGIVRLDTTTLMPQAAPLEISLPWRFVAVVVLSGTAAISLVDGAAEPVTTPELIALREGELLVLRPLVVGGDGYDRITIRAGTPIAQILRFVIG